MTYLSIWARDAATGEAFECFTWTRDSASGIARAYADAERHGRPISHAWIGRTLLDTCDPRYSLQSQSGRYLGAFETYQAAFNHRAQKGLSGWRVVDYPNEWRDARA
jgi:hypothetical protein